MERIDIINTIGRKFLTSNIENGEFSYQQVFQERIQGHQKIDLRFSGNGVVILLETKRRFGENDEIQLNAYVSLEKKIGSNKIISILANTTNDNIKVWKNDILLLEENSIRSFQEYVDMFDMTRVNNKEQIMEATYKLNELLHGYISEGLRSQFVGTCLLALRNDLVYEDNRMSNIQILAGIEEKLNLLLSEDIRKKEKLDILSNKVLGTQEVRQLSNEKFKEILNYIKVHILPFIDERTHQGKDLLNLFFTTFNKYVGKKDKNQAFTPDHIVHFMCKVANINKNSIILDPTCGSGAFLVQGLTQALKGCHTREEEIKVKTNNIYGIEKEEKAFGLATTNMLIHGDGNSNIYNNSCFDKLKDLKDKNINIILMNPPYNATVSDVPPEFSNTWDTASDPTNGFYFVLRTLEIMQHQGKLLCLLPTSCATGGNSQIILDCKQKILENNTLDAVFSLPNDLFHPGANVSACCMIFDINTPHSTCEKKTFFGFFKNDGFKKKKNLGRVDINNNWDDIEKDWLNLYKNRIEKPGISALKRVDYQDEWLAEAYMETDYSKLTNKDFEITVKKYISYLIGSDVEINDE